MAIPIVASLMVQLKTAYQANNAAELDVMMVEMSQDRLVLT